MATNPNDTLITADKKDRDRLKKHADTEGRTMKGMLKVLLDEHEEKKNANTRK